MNRTADEPLRRGHSAAATPATAASAFIAAIATMRRLRHSRGSARKRARHQDNFSGSAPELEAQRDEELAQTPPAREPVPLMHGTD